VVTETADSQEEKEIEEDFKQCVHTLVRIKGMVSSGTVFAVIMAINSVYGGTMKTIRNQWC
jgi:hypothetical protein